MFSLVRRGACSKNPPIVLLSKSGDGKSYPKYQKKTNHKNFETQQGEVSYILCAAYWSYILYQVIDEIQPSADLCTGGCIIIIIICIKRYRFATYSAAGSRCYYVLTNQKTCGHEMSFSAAATIAAALLIRLRLLLGLLLPLLRRLLLPLLDRYC